MNSRLTGFAASCSGTDVNGDTYCTNLPQATASGANLQNIVQIVLSIFAVIAVLIIVIAALNIVTAGGDPAKVAKARSTILYALIGLIIAISADVIVALIAGRL